VQSQFGGRGLARLARTLTPERAVVLGRTGDASKPPSGWERVPIERVAVAALFPETPVETVTNHDITTLAARVGLQGPEQPIHPGHEGPVRERIAAFLPRWARPQIDQRGNLTVESLRVVVGTTSAAETRALGITEGSAVTIRKRLHTLGPWRAAGRSMDDRAGSTALLLALRQIDPATVKNRVTFAWTVEEETGLAGAAFLASRLQPDFAFAVDTFVSTDTPVDVQHLAHAKLGKGPVLRAMDSRTVAPRATIERIVTLARDAGIPLQVGVTQGGTDASVFSAAGAIDVGLSWPGRYSHSPVGGDRERF
jgi:hypothetical protein